jgi:hypothetical protein
MVGLLPLSLHRVAAGESVTGRSDSVFAVVAAELDFALVAGAAH